MATVITIPRPRAFPLANALRSCGYTHKFQVLYSDINQQSETGVVAVQLPQTPVNSTILSAGLWGRVDFSATLSAPSLCTDTAGMDPIFDFNTPAVGTLSTGAAQQEVLGLSSATIYLVLDLGGTNFNTLTSGEIWLFLSLINIDLAT